MFDTTFSICNDGCRLCSKRDDKSVCLLCDNYNGYYLNQDLACVESQDLGCMLNLSATEQPECVFCKSGYFLDNTKCVQNPIDISNC